MNQEIAFDDFNNYLENSIEKIKNIAILESTHNKHYVFMGQCSLISNSDENKREIITKGLAGCTAAYVGYKHPSGLNFAFLSHFDTSPSSIIENMTYIEEMLDNNIFKESEIVSAEIYLTEDCHFKYLEISILAAYGKDFEIKKVKYDIGRPISELSITIPSFEIKRVDRSQFIDIGPNFLHTFSPRCR